MLCDNPLIADWKKIGEHGQLLTNRNIDHENKGQIDYDYLVGQKVLLRNNGILLAAISVLYNTYFGRAPPKARR
jgi:hypothetical protein